jgi:eukaryotic-like serine/threonine-protein kinase
MSSTPSWDRVKTVFQEVLDRPLEERSARLRELCGADRGLQAEVESLLATHNDAGSFAERPAQELLDALGVERASAANGASVRPGSRLGVYEIQSLLGAGGMGDVYKARDPRLDRAVAIKVLPTHLAADRDRFQRFEREARAVARLDHPHIGALYDVGEDDGLHFLVMQYLEGEPLAARLVKGPLAIDQVLRYAAQIADALDHAHRRGIVHRDLKPGNIVLTKAGATLLDFGLAKWRVAATSGIGSGPGLKPAPVADSLTADGLIVGTLHYMAPEQLEEKETDARTDLFALGVVIYEMVTGMKAFDGSSSASVMAAILSTQPPAMTTRQPLTPPALEHVVTTCLAKDPDERWQAAGDVARELRWIAESGAEASVVAAASLRSRRAIPVLGLVGLLAGGVASAATVWSTLRTRFTQPPLRVSRTGVLAPNGGVFGGGLALSPDGAHVAYEVIGGDGRQQLYLRSLDEFDAKPIMGTEDACCPFFSPDNRWLAFSEGTKLKRVAVSGGAIQVICDHPGNYGATWGADDTIVFSPSANEGLYRVAASGGTPQVVTKPDRDNHEKGHRQPQFLPDGKAVVFTIVPNNVRSFDEARVAVLSLDTGQIRVLVEGGTNPRFVPTGHLMYARGPTLFAAPFDPRRSQITGQSAPALDDVRTELDGGSMDLSVSGDGLLAYIRGSLSGDDNRVVWVDRQGRAEPLMDARGAFASAGLSPDSKRLALTITGPNDQLWLYDFARGTLTQLTFAWDNMTAYWTPDSKRIAFLSDRSGPPNFYWLTPDGSGRVERLTDGPARQGGGSWLPDGKSFAYVDVAPATGWDIWLLTVEPERRVRPLIQRPFDQWFARFSPDGRWLAYASDETGRTEVYVQPFPALGERWQISNDGGTQPMWDRHGRELYYQNGRKLMAASLRTQPTFAAARPRLLFTGPYVWGANIDVAPDGRFIMIESGPSQAPPTQITLVQNWLEELKRRVPTK